MAWTSLALLVPATAPAGRMLGSATEELLRDHVHVLIGRALDRQDGRIRFAFEESLHGDMRSRAAILVTPATHNRVKIGSHYIVAFTDYRTDPFYREGLVLDPRAPRVVSLALVEDFVLEDRPETRRLVLGANDPTMAPRAQVSDALTLLASDDVFAQRFAALELYGREDLRLAASDQDRARWSKLLHAGATETQAQDFLYRAALRLPPDSDRAWIANGARDVLNLNELPVDFRSSLPALLTTALDALAKTGNTTDTAQLAPLLRADHPGIAKAALSAMDALDRPTTLTLANQLLLTGANGSELRRALQAYVTRWQE